MTRRISTSELEERLPDILEMIHRRGERFVIERDGEPLATLAPPNNESAITWNEFIARLAEIPGPDDQFADDLEDVQVTMNRQEIEPPEWPS
jgi:hypothetical protein